MKETSAWDISEANNVFGKNLTCIHSVEEWARSVGYRNTDQFSRHYRNYFGKRPKAEMVKIRLQKAISLLKASPEISCYEVARAIGKKDEKALHKYFKTHAGKPPSAFRTQKGGRKMGNDFSSL